MAVIMLILRTSHSLLTGSSVFASFYVMNFIIRFATSVVVARTLGVEGKGIYSLVLMTSTFAILLINPGINTALVYFTSRGELNQFNHVALSLTLAGGISLFGGIFFIALYYLGFTRLLLAGVSSVHLGYVLISLPLVLGASFLSSILLGNQRILMFNSMESLRLTSTFFFQVYSSFSGGGIEGALTSWVAGICIAFIASLWYLRKEFTKSWKVKLSILPTIYSYGFRSYPVNLLNFLNTRLDTYIINFFGETQQVGLYTTSTSVAEILWFVPNAFSNTVFSKIGSLNSESATQLTSRACRQAIFITSNMTIISAILMPFIIPFLFGPAFSSASLPFLLLLPGILGLSINRVLAADFNGRGKPQYVTYSALLAAGLTIILDFIFIPRMGILGAAVVSSLAYLVSTMLLLTWFLQQNHVKWGTVLIPTSQDIREMIGFLKHIISRVKLILKG